MISGGWVQLPSPSFFCRKRKKQRKAAFGLSAPQAKRGHTPLEAGLDFRPLHSIYWAGLLRSSLAFN
jgi:hypothetical protein